MLGIVFIPMLLDGSGLDRQTETKLRVPRSFEPAEPVASAQKAQTPLPPPVLAQKPKQEVSTPAVAPKKQATQPEAAPPKPAIESTLLPADKKVVKPLPAKTVVAPDNLRGWIIQLASFGQRGNADALVEKLRKSGNPAFVSGSKKVYRVRIGPFKEKQRAQKVLERANKAHGMKGYIIRQPG